MHKTEVLRNDEMNILIYDATGDLTGSKGNVLESYLGISKLQGAKTPEGEINYYVDRINEFSDFVYANNNLEGSNSGLNDGNLVDVGTPMAHDVEC